MTDLVMFSCEPFVAYFARKLYQTFFDSGALPLAFRCWHFLSDSHILPLFLSESHILPLLALSLRIAYSSVVGTFSQNSIFFRCWHFLSDSPILPLLALSLRFAHSSVVGTFSQIRVFFRCWHFHSDSHILSALSKDGKTFYELHTRLTEDTRMRALPLNLIFF